jgi:DnaK suppressor protein
LERQRVTVTKTELQALHRALATKQSELRNENQNREALTIETSPDELDRIQHAGDRDRAMGNLERSSNRLREVQTALQRIEAGTFGICGGCEGDITPKRLAAVPWAWLCIACQEAADREQKPTWSEIEIEMAA